MTSTRISRFSLGNYGKTDRLRVSLIPSTMFGVCMLASLLSANSAQAQTRPSDIRSTFELSTSNGWDNVTSLEKGPRLNSAKLGVQVLWKLKGFDLEAGLAGGMSSSYGDYAFSPLGLVRIKKSRGPLSVSLGLENSIAINRKNTRDTSITNPRGDTLAGGVIGDGASRFTNSIGAADLVGTVGWQSEWAAIEIVAGVNPTSSQKNNWIGYNIGVGIGHSSAIFLSARKQPKNVDIRIPSLSLGFKTTYWKSRRAAGKADSAKSKSDSSSVAVAMANHSHASPNAIVRFNASGDSVELTIRVMGAKSVSVSGDPTDWDAVAMKSLGANRWTITLATRNSIQRLQFKTDNSDWGEIPGLPVTRGEYGGNVSLLVPPDK